MESIRELLRCNLRRTLSDLPDTDRLAAAWPVVCGVAMAAHGRVAGFDNGMVAIRVADENWLRQMLSMQGQIACELGRVAGVRVSGLHFQLARELS